MNSFKLESGVEITIPSTVEGGGKVYKIWCNEWKKEDLHRLYIYAYPAGVKEGIKCGFICLRTGSKHLVSTPAWLAVLISNKTVVPQPRVEKVELYVIVHKKHGSIGVYREIVDGPRPFQDANDTVGPLASWMTTDATINFSVEPYNGKGVGETY